MNPKHVGLVLVLVGVSLAMLTHMSKVREDRLIDHLIEAQGGSCYLADGVCLHSDRNYTPQIVGWTLSAIIISIGVYLMLAGRDQQAMAKQHLEVANALKHAKKESDKKDKFNAFLSSFTPEEQSVLRAVHDQDGIKQSTLRFRTGMSKTALSLMLKTLESREIISRKAAGKTNQIFLRKRF